MSGGDWNPARDTQVLFFTTEITESTENGAKREKEKAK
jgi:hypothetical protein